MPELKSAVATLRAYVQQRVDATSLREVADEIGMSFSGLRSFLAGTAPHPSTVRKISTWYTLRRDGRLPKKPAKISRSEVDGAIGLIVASLRTISDLERRHGAYRTLCLTIARDAGLTNS